MTKKGERGGQREGRGQRATKGDETNLIATENLDLIFPLLPLLSHHPITRGSLVQSRSERLSLLSEVSVDFVRSRSRPFWSRRRRGFVPSSKSFVLLVFLIQSVESL